MELMTLALLAQQSSPLLLDFAVDPTQLFSAMMQSKVLVEPL
jgi:hypothetical protein